MKTYKTPSALLLSLVILLASASFTQTIDEGKKLLRNERFSEAEILFKKLASENPNSPELQYYAGKTQMMLGKSENAKSAFKNGIAIDGESALNYAGLGAAEMASNNSTEAKKFFDQALEHASDAPIVLLEIADFYTFAGSGESAWLIELLDNALNAKKVLYKSRICTKIGDLYFIQNKMSDAIRYYQRAVDSDNKSIDAYLGIGKINLRIKSYPEAELQLLNALAIDTMYSATHRELAEYYYTVKKYYQAAAAYEKYIELSAADFKKELRLITFLYLAKDYFSALQLLYDLEADDAQNSMVKHLIALSLYSLDDFELGAPAFDKYFSLAASDEITANDCLFYGQLLTKAGSDSLAVIYYNKSVALGNDTYEIYSDLAESYFRLKNWDNAILNFNLKEQKSGKQLTLREYFDLGQSYFYNQNFVDAGRTFEKIVAMKPELALGYLWLAFSNASIDSTTENGLAKPYYEKFIELASKTPEKYKNQLLQAYSYLGYFYYLKREDENYKNTWKENYKTNWEKVLEIDPKNVQAIEALKNVK